jgi:peptidoglycan/xylan/chitin deacetylase (PgdA/CDA1 family)
MLIKNTKGLIYFTLSLAITAFIIFTILEKNIMAVPTINLENRKVLYLTFDDGPSIITNELLDTLKACNSKATFFVVGKEIINRESTLKRIHNEGHSIGLHTYSHNFHKIYKNENAFIKEMLDTKVLVEKITGCSTNIIRFPGGSSKHLDSKLLELLHENNLKVFDWNISIEDGTNPDLSVNDLVKNSKKCKTCDNSVILLMHCNSNNMNTVKALPKIISYYKDLGYEILPITNDTEEYHYRFKK